MEFNDKNIKDFFAKDVFIPDETNKVFDSTLEKIKIEDRNKKKQRVPIFYFRKFAAVAACVLIVFVSADAYARTSGYSNIFFMIREVFEEKTLDKEDIFTDRDITISYQSFNVTNNIEMQVNELQIKDNKAKLYLYVKELTDNVEEPLKYKVFNENGTLTYEGKSSKEEKTQYTEVLELKNYIENQKLITLQVLNNKNELLKTVVINLDEKVIEARTEKVEIKKISQIKLNDFLSNETKKKLLSSDDDRILILKLTDISYSNSVYTVRYLYSKITNEDIKKGNVENAEVQEGIVNFEIKKDEYSLISIKISENLETNEKNSQNVNQKQNNEV